MTRNSEPINQTDSLDAVSNADSARLNLDDRAVAAFERTVARAIAPYNIAGLCDPTVNNMYRYTAIPITEDDDHTG